MDRTYGGCDEDAMVLGEDGEFKFGRHEICIFIIVTVCTTFLRSVI